MNDLEVHIYYNTNTGGQDWGLYGIADPASDNTLIINYAWIWQKTYDNVQVRVDLWPVAVETTVKTLNQKARIDHKTLKQKKKSATSKCISKSISNQFSLFI